MISQVFRADGASVTARILQNGEACLGELQGIDLSSQKQAIKQGKQWLNQQGAKQILGPMDFATWGKYRCWDGLPSAIPLFEFEKASVDLDLKPWTESGFTPFEWYSTTIYCAKKEEELVGLLRSGERLRKRLAKQGYHFETRTADQLTADWLKIIYDLTRESFSQAAHFMDISLVDFLQLTVQSGAKSKNSLVSIAHKKGVPLGFVYGFSDGEAWVYKTIAVKPESRNFGLPIGLLYENGYSPIVSLKLSQVVSALYRDGTQTPLLVAPTPSAGVQIYNRKYCLLKAVDISS